MIVEDDVVGSGTGYDQANYYNTRTDYPELQAAGNPIKGYKHCMVQRDCPLDGIYGKAGSIPASPATGTPYSVPVSYTVPAQYKGLNVVLSNLYLVAFVGYNNGAVLNSEQVKLVGSAPVVSPVAQHPRDMTPQITAAGSRIFMRVAAPGLHTVRLYSAAGRLMGCATYRILCAGIHDISGFGRVPTGMIIVNVSGAAGTHTAKLFIGR
jgi:hypothetical protein